MTLCFMLDGLLGIEENAKKNVRAGPAIYETNDNADACVQASLVRLIVVRL